MSNPKRLVKIEAALSPQQAVILWLRGARLESSLAELNNRLTKLPLSETPRSRINRQVAGAVRVALKGRSTEMIEKAVRAAAMQADFLILLVLTVNEEILRHSECRRLRLELLAEQVRHRGGDWTDVEQEEWIGRFLLGVSDVVVLRAAVGRVRDEHFRGNEVLFSDAAQTLQEELTLVQHVCAAHDRVVAGIVEATTDLGPLLDRVEPLAAFRADYLVAKAKSDMLREFSGNEAAASVMRQYWTRMENSCAHQAADS
jgi:hypothetical protein